jgi:hypothetical protein
MFERHGGATEHLGRHRGQHALHRGAHGRGRRPKPAANGLSSTASVRSRPSRPKNHRPQPRSAAASAVASSRASASPPTCAA